mmetsp:Transcript_49615/g.144229  ORF Transcript_49615/g.144229 Transcript_49615/m.144229 type:complete len:206 (-) Transcript_49615:770-1387(-)
MGLALALVAAALHRFDLTLLLLPLAFGLLLGCRCIGRYGLGAALGLAGLGRLLCLLLEGLLLLPLRWLRVLLRDLRLLGFLPRALLALLLGLGRLLRRLLLFGLGIVVVVVALVVVLDAKAVVGRDKELDKALVERLDDVLPTCVGQVGVQDRRIDAETLEQDLKPVGVVDVFHKHQRLAGDQLQFEERVEDQILVRLVADVVEL